MAQVCPKLFMLGGGQGPIKEAVTLERPLTVLPVGLARGHQLAAERDE
jgi:hypothetical protein